MEFEWFGLFLIISMPSEMRSRWVHLIWSRSKRNLLPSHKQWSSYQKCRMRGKNAFKRIALDGSWAVAKTINMEPSFPRMPTLCRQSRITKLMQCNAMNSLQLHAFGNISTRTFQLPVSHQDFLNSNFASKCWCPWRVSVRYEKHHFAKNDLFHVKSQKMSLFAWKFHLIAIRLNIVLSTQEYDYDDDDCYFYDWGSLSGMELSLCDGKRSQSSTRTRFVIFSTHLRLPSL